MSQPTPPRLSLGQLLTLPVFAAVAMACIAPAVRTGAVKQYGLVQVVFWEAIGVPVALAVTAFLVVRGGRRRDRMVAGFLWASAASATLAVLAMAGSSLLGIGASVASGKGVPVDLAAFAVAMAGGLLMLIEAMRTLRARVLPTTCPACGRRAVFPDLGGADHGGRAAFICDDCGITFESRPRAGAPDDRDGEAPSDSARLATTA